MTRVAILGTGVFTPEFPNRDAWVQGAPLDAPAKPSGEVIDRRNRRRVSTLTKALADAYGEAFAAADVDPSTLRTVFGSALGEASTMIGLLDQMWRHGEGLSPMKFAMSVHNAASGVVSIGQNNHAFTTSLGSDFDTPAMSLMEAVALAVTDDAPVGVVCGDDGVPLDIVEENDAWVLAAGAVVIASVAHAPNAPTLSLGFDAPTIEPPALSGPLSRNPNVGILDLIHAVEQRTDGTLRLDRGAGRGWSATLEFP